MRTNSVDIHTCKRFVTLYSTSVRSYDARRRTAKRPVVRYMYLVLINLYSRKDNSDIFVVSSWIHLCTIKYNDLFDMITYLCPYMQDKNYINMQCNYVNMQHNCVNTYQINMLTLTWLCWVSNKIRQHVDINMLHVKSIACWHKIMSHVNIIMLHVDTIDLPFSCREQKYTTIHSQDDSFCQPNHE